MTAEDQVEVLLEQNERYHALLAQTFAWRPTIDRAIQLIDDQEARIVALENGLRDIANPKICPNWLDAADIADRLLESSGRDIA